MSKISNGKEMPTSKNLVHRKADL